MRIRELLAVESIDLNAKAASKKEALDHAVDLMARSGKIGDVETYRKGTGTCGNACCRRCGFPVAGR